MTHDELLAKVHKNCENSGDVFAHALCAVVELHKPMPAQFEEGAISCFECSTMDYDVYWDECPTIQAIKKELQ